MEIFYGKTSSWAAKNFPSPKLNARFPPLQETDMVAIKISES